MPTDLQEVELMAHAASLPEEERNKPLPPPPADLLQKLHLAAGDLGGRRGQIAANVFKPSHNLPTRSLREQVSVIWPQWFAEQTSDVHGTRCFGWIVLVICFILCLM